MSNLKWEGYLVRGAKSWRFTCQELIDSKWHISSLYVFFFAKAKSLKILGEDFLTCFYLPFLIKTPLRGLVETDVFAVCHSFITLPRQGGRVKWVPLYCFLIDSEHFLIPAALHSIVQTRHLHPPCALFSLFSLFSCAFFCLSLVSCFAPFHLADGEAETSLHPKPLQPPHASIPLIWPCR